MEVRLVKKANLTGSDMAKQWEATVVNKEGVAVIQTRSISGKGAITQLRQEIKGLANAVEEFATMKEGI